MNYLWDERFRLFRRSTLNEVAYSDGAEGRLLSVISQATDCGTFSPELAEAINDWPSEYHLSRARHCLVRPLGIRAGSKVLELGCGCGAVTRYLGEIGANVVAVEGNLARARVAAERNRGLPNVRVVVDDLLLFETEETFDWVVLIGVLEYAAVFCTSQNPFERYLRSVSRFLTRGGRVVVAIENKLGLKYFNGCAEDHVGAPYFGIQGLYEPKTPRTFSRRELIAELAAAGLQHTYFYYPFPDYKLPSVILTEDALSDPDFDPIDLIARSDGRDYSGSPYRVFDEALAFAAVGKNGLLADLSNSFLVVAATEVVSPIQASELATTFSYYRVPKFVTQTRFVRSAEEILVLKEHLVPWGGERSLVTGGMTITNSLDESAYQQGRQIIWRLLRARAKSGDLESVVAALQPWMEFLLRHARRMATVPLADSVGQFPSPGSYTLPGNFLDCTPFNLLESGEELASIDLEWCADRDVPLGWVVTRGVLWSLTSGLPTADHLQSVTVVIEALYKKFGFVVSEPDLQVWLEQEAAFQTMVTGRPHHGVLTDRTSSGMRSMVSEIVSLNQQLAARNEQMVSLAQAVAARDEQVEIRDAQVSKLKQEVAAQDQQLAQQQQEIARLDNQVAIWREQVDESRARIAVLEQGLTAAHRDLSSLSWRITKPLRSLSSAFPRTAKISREGLKVAYWTLTWQLPRRIRQRKVARILLESGLFDPNFYLTQYPDIAKTGINPLSHYLSQGVVEGRMPNLYFDTTFYLQQNADVAASGVNPLLHYLLDGFREGREPSPKFSGRLYLEQNPDVAASGMNPLAHFLRFGRLEGRAAPVDTSCKGALGRQLVESGFFDPNFYLTQYPDVAKTGINPLSHYLSHGVVEGRMPNLYFDTTFYLQQNADVAASGVNPLLHYLLDGFREGREPSPKFSGRLYLEQNPDVAASGMNPLAHFLRFGRAEGRRAPVIWPSGAVTGDPSSRVELILQARDNVRRILVIDHAVPSPDMDSGSVRMFGLLRLLRGLGSPVTFASGRLENNINHVEATEKLGVEMLVGYTDIRSHLEQRGGAYTLAIISRPETAATYIPLVRAYAPYAEVVYDSVDLHYLRFQRAAELTDDPRDGRRAELYLQLETLAFTFADRSIAITETEKRAILRKWPQAIVEVVPNVHSVRISPMPWEARKGLVFIGGYDHEPNVDAVTWFVQEVFPKVQEQIPDIRFTILGSKPPESVKRLARNNVDVLGWVPDPAPYFELSRIFVAPLRYGAGMKGKIGQAMSLGLPVVTTRIGAEGMQLVDGTHALIADDASTFATAVVRLYNNEVLWTSLQGAAAAHIERNFSDAAVENILRRLFWGEEPSAKLGSG